MALTAAHPRTVRRNRTPLWLMLSGVVIAVVGAIVMGVASGRKDSAELSSAFGKAMGNPFPDPRLADAVSLGHFGLGVLIFGLALVLVGIAAQAVRH